MEWPHWVGGHFSAWKKEKGDAHGVVPGGKVPRGAAHGYKYLVVDGSAALEELPVERPRREVECAGVDEGVAALFGEVVSAWRGSPLVDG